MYHYDVSYSTPDPSADANVGLAWLFIFFIFLLAYVVTSYLTGRIFKKAGVPQWAAWVPIYNSWRELELGDQQGFWALLTLVPFVNLVATIFLYIARYHIGKKLGKDDWFVLLAIFLPVVWLIWLGFDDSKWPTSKKTAPAAKKAPTATKAPDKKKSATRKKSA
ncbi:MAG TPA: DUF5684 domain-containing protein [Candidatus Bathyarchaeia archaeon]|nr:DUF5684 domain-containing protein [Candidatus Bathyarchaeia archaeon]